MTYEPEQEPYVALRTKALESLLIEKGLLTSDAIDSQIARYEKDIGPLTGARVVARAWTDSGFRERLLADGGSAIAEMGLPGGAKLVVVENTTTRHNLIVCTLCSCYPWMVLGLPPTWYKSFSYRSRAVLREFGLELGDDVTIHVWDSSAEQRYMVLPQRPEGTDHLTEEQLAALVTRDAMIGVSKVAAAGDGREER